MIVRARWLFPLTLLALSACGGSNGSTIPPESSAARVAPATTRNVFIQLPAIVTASPPIPGPRALASTTKSVTVSIGKHNYETVDLSAKNPNCTPNARGLQCNVTVAVNSSKGDAPIKLTFYARKRGLGPPIAFATQSVEESHLDTVVGLAQKLTLIANPNPLRSGVPGTASLVTYGVDAAGGLIPDTALMIGTQHVGLIHYTASGPYSLNATASAFSPVYFVYDGSKSGDEKVTATPKAGLAVSTDVQIEPLPSPSPEIFAGITPFYTPAIAEFPGTASGDVAPLRIPLSSFVATVFAADAYNGVWVLSPADQSYSNAAGVATRYASDSTWLENVTVNGMNSAAIDAGGNFYAGVGNKIQIYTPGLYGRKLVRSISLGHPAGPITVDGSGNVYVGNYNKSVDEYAAGVAGNAPPSQVFPTGATPYQLAADASGDLFVNFTASSYETVGGGGIWEFPAGSTTPMPLLGGLVVLGFALDHTGTIYASIGNAGANYSIEVFPSGATSPSQVISGPNTALALPAGIAVTP